jgi:hypothetical protein
MASRMHSWKGQNFIGEYMERKEPKFGCQLMFAFVLVANAIAVKCNRCPRPHTNMTQRRRRRQKGRHTPFGWSRSLGSATQMAVFDCRWTNIRWGRR